MAGEMITPSTGNNADSAKAPGEKQRRERSTIEFPYGDLDDAIDVAQAIHENAGTSCSTDQLAGFMRQTVTSGAFRLKTGTARIFGLVETERGSLTLTSLGRQIMDQSLEKNARASAFLTVPLYQAVFDKFKGHMLPPPAALEREMANFGVAQKQTGRARQAFERSAEQAGFFVHGTDRLIMPAGLSRLETAPLETPPKEPHKDTKRGNGGDEPPMHPFIKGLLEALPPAHSDWSIPDRVKWLETASSIFGLIYNGPGTIRIEGQET